jgi:hypothetical protein
METAWKEIVAAVAAALLALVATIRWLLLARAPAPNHDHDVQLHRLTTLENSVDGLKKDLKERLDHLDDRLGVHGERLAHLEAKVNGRR